MTNPEVPEQRGIREVPGRVPLVEIQPVFGPHPDQRTAQEKPPRPQLTDWQLTVESRARRVYADLAMMESVPGTERECALVTRTLAVVDGILCSRQSWWRAMTSWWSGWHIERAWRALHEAEAGVVSADPELVAHLPALRERVAAYLGEDDRRRRALEELRPSTPPSTAERAVVVDALRAAFDASDDAHGAARALRNKLVITAAVLALLNTLMGVVGLLRPGVIPMCVQPPVTAGVVCPSGQDPGAADVWLVQLLGAFGAMIAAVVLLVRRRPSLSPYVLIGYQAMIKILLGAGLAVVGVLAMGAGATEGLLCVRSAPALLLWSVLLGYSQQAGTRLLDNYADRVMDRVRPLPDLNGAAPGTVR